VSVAPLEGPTYIADRAEFRVVSGRDATKARSEKRRYWTRRVETTEIALVRRGLSEIYIALGDARPAASGEGAAWSVHAYHHPLILLIWLGAALMAAGGTLALADRRLRLAIVRKRTSAVAQAQPAE
jgi:cytochrome c-type biogenesis protein CcmF